MKSYIVPTTIYFSLLLLACQDTGEDLKNASADVAFYKTIGEEIPFETGMQWMEFYKDKNSEQGRVALATYTISASRVEQMLQSVSNPAGVAFHYGKDWLGVKHIIAIPVDESLSLWSSIPGRVFVDANTGNVISQSLANTWAQNYKNAHPTGIWFHFFGQDIMDEITAIPFFNSIDIEPAINILNLTPQMLLIVWNEDLNILGRTTEDEGRIFDASYPCPPCAVE